MNIHLKQCDNGCCKSRRKDHALLVSSATPFPDYFQQTDEQRKRRLEKSRAQRILWLLEELNLSYDLKIYKRGEHNFAPPELKQVHPLGKSPIITIESPATPRPLVLAESGVIVEYLCDHFGGRLVPRRYAEGKEGQVGGETESWLRYRYYMHYAEGSLMPLALVQILLSSEFFIFMTLL